MDPKRSRGTLESEKNASEGTTKKEEKKNIETRRSESTVGLKSARADSHGRALSSKPPLYFPLRADINFNHAESVLSVIRNPPTVSRAPLPPHLPLI